MFVVRRLYITWRFLRGVEHQFQSLRVGVDDVLPLHLLRHFDERELDVSEFHHHSPSTSRLSFHQVSVRLSVSSSSIITRKVFKRFSWNLVALRTAVMRSIHEILRLAILKMAAWQPSWIYVVICMNIAEIVKKYTNAR